MGPTTIVGDTEVKPLALIIFTVTSGPHEGVQLEFVDPMPCSEEVLTSTFDYLSSHDMPAMAQCYYGNGPLTTMRPVARPER